MTSESHEAFSSVKYYQLNDANVDGYYDDWRFKTLLLIGTKGWSAPFDMPDETIPTKEDAESSEATDDERKLYKANKEAHNLIAESLLLLL